MTSSTAPKTPQDKVAANLRHLPLLRTGVFTCLTLAIIGGIFYGMLTTCHKIQTLTAETLALKQQQTDIKIQLVSTYDTLQLAQSTVTNKLGDLDNKLASAMQERWYQNNDWLLLKARYYLELAEINAHWSDNTPTTVALFKQADALLLNLQEPQVFSVRQEIAKEIAQIQAVQPLDVAGLLSQLDAAQHLVVTLPSKNPLTQTKANPAMDKTIKSPTTWREHLQNSLFKLEKLVIIRHHDVPIQPLLTPEYDSILRENIRLNLQEAQWAVLQKNQAVYALSLTQAIDNINQLFDQNATSTQSLIKLVNDLQSTQLNMPALVPGQSLLLLNQLIDSKKSPVAGEHS